MQLIKKFLLGNDTNITKKAYVWNTASSLITAAFTTLLLILISRVMPMESAGMFSIAIACASLFEVVGAYAMREFMVTDTNEVYSIFEYRRSRIITCLSMLFISVCYIAFNMISGSYSLEKATIVMIMCMFFTIEAYENVYIGFYQKYGRLDVGAKILTYRYIISIACFYIYALITKNLLISLLVMLGVTALVSSLGIFSTRRHFIDQINNKTLDNKNVLKLLGTCLPLCISSFLTIYIVNSPKYAIDMILTDTMQAYYGYISMPVFIITILNKFIYMPILPKFGQMWNNKNYKGFTSLLAKQFVIIAVLIVLALSGLWLLGIPLLSIIYNTDLTAYKTPMMILTLSGSMYAIGGFINIILITIRKYKISFFVFLADVLITLFLMSNAVRSYEIMGAVTAHLIITTALAVALAVVMVVCIKKAKK